MIMLQIKNLYKKLSETFSIEIPNLSINKGEKVLLLGENGSGKSSLLRIIAGIWKPDKGTIIKSYNVQSYSPPDFSLIPDLKVRTIWEAYTAIWNAHWELIKVFNLEELFTLPCRALSDGQKQRLLLSMVLVKSADVYLLDEPERSLDKHYTNELISILNRIHKTFIIATHDRTLIEKLHSRKIELKNGKVICEC